MATKVGAGIPGFGASKGGGGGSRMWDDGEYLIELENVSAKPAVRDNEEVEGVISVMVQGTFLGGPTQEDDTDPKGKKVTTFINVDFVDETKAFTIDNLKDLFIAAGVKTSGDEPPYKKLEGKKVVAVVTHSKPAANGKVYNRFYWRHPSKSKNFAEEE